MVGKMQNVRQNEHKQGQKNQNGTPQQRQRKGNKYQNETTTKMWTHNTQGKTTKA